MNDQTINREAGDKTKGYRLQRLRAVQLMLNKMKESDKVAVYAATEYLDDVFTRTVNADGEVSEYSEGDKDYGSKKSFSFNSNEVKNSLVIFLDSWFSNKLSSRLHFGFYTNIQSGKEYNTKALQEMGVELPKMPIIQVLIKRDYSDENLLPTIKKILLEEYRDQYKDREEKGYLENIEKWDDTLWLDFLNRIDWKFGQEDDVELEKTLLHEIKESKFYNSNLDGREEYVLGALLQEFERKENEEDFLVRLVNDSDVKVKFLEIATHNYKNEDPIYEEWERIEQPIDKRNINEKIITVCPDYNERKIAIFARKIGAVKVEFSRIDNKEKGSYQYRIFEACESLLFDLLESHKGKDITPEVIDDWLAQLEECAEAHLVDKSKDFVYAFSNKDTLKKVILELFDSCFLAFDEGEANE